MCVETLETTSMCTYHRNTRSSINPIILSINTPPPFPKKPLRSFRNFGYPHPNPKNSFYSSPYSHSFHGNLVRHFIKLSIIVIIDCERKQVYIIIM